MLVSVVLGGAGVAVASNGVVTSPVDAGSMLLDPVVFSPPITTDESGVFLPGTDVTVGTEGDGSNGSIDPQIFETAVPAARTPALIPVRPAFYIGSVMLLLLAGMIRVRKIRRILL